jgi:hypothetical protein
LVLACDSGICRRRSRSDYVLRKAIETAVMNRSATASVFFPITYPTRVCLASAGMYVIPTRPFQSSSIFHKNTMGVYTDSGTILALTVSG